VTASPRLDVVVVTFQSALHLEACLNSLPAWANVIVVDNASTDSSADIAERLGAVVLRNAANRGFAAAANQGSRLGRAELILLLNPDASIDEANLTVLLSAFDDPRVAVAGPRLVTPDGETQRAFWPFPSPGREWTAALGGEGLLERVGPAARGFVVGACFAVRRSVWERLGRFDEAFWLYGEEADFCKRVTEDGLTVRLVTAASASHIGGASSVGRESLSFEHFVRGTERYVLKHHGSAGLVSFRSAGVVKHRLRSLVRRRRAEGTLHRAFARRSATALRHHPFMVHRPERRARRQLVLASLEAWDEVWRRNAFLVRELVAADPELRVLWVEPAHDVLHVLRTRRRIDLGTHGRIRPVPELPAVLRFQPTKWLPRVVGPFADRSLARQVQRAAAQVGFTNPVLWLNDAGLTELSGRTAWPLLYDITDDWQSAETTRRERRRLVEREELLLARAAEVVVCSPELVRRRGEVRPVTLIPNAVDTAHFTVPRARPEDLPPGPVAVYVGTLHEHRLDVDLVVRLARELPDLPLVLVGPNALTPANTARLASHANVHLLGSRPYGEVPGYLQYADVVIIPHVVTEFTESLDPIKAYEVAVTGRPTVATAVAGFRDLGGSVVVADRERFPAEVRRLLREPPATEPVDVASWGDRAREFTAALERAAQPVSRLDHQQRIKVVYLGHCARLSGAELALARLLPALHGVDAHVILAEDGPLVAKLQDLDVSVEVLPMDERARLLKKDRVRPGGFPLDAAVAAIRYSIVLARRLRELEPDLVHANTLKAIVYGSLAAPLARTKLVWHVRDRIAPDYLPAPAVRAVRLLARLVPSAVIANSEATLGLLGALRNPSLAVPSPVVFDAVEMPEVTATSPAGPLRVGMLGRIAPWKGQDVFLRAFARAFPHGETQAVIIGSALFGEDEYAASLHTLSERLGITERVEFVGFTSDIWSELAHLSVLVHASVIPEPFGQVVIEGMAAGLPVIACDAGGPAEVITHGVDGLLVPPNDPEALAAAMLLLSRDDALRIRLGNAGRQRARSFSPERVAPVVEDLYRRLVPVPSRTSDPPRSGG